MQKVSAIRSTWAAFVRRCGLDSEREGPQQKDGGDNGFRSSARRYRAARVDGCAGRSVAAGHGRAGHRGCPVRRRAVHRQAAVHLAALERTTAVRFQEPAEGGLRRAAVSIRLWPERERPFAGDSRLPGRVRIGQSGISVKCAMHIHILQRQFLISNPTQHKLYQTSRGITISQYFCDYENI